MSPYDGSWKDSTNANAVGGTMSVLASGTTPDTFTWNAQVPGPGDYKVEAHYVPYTTRGTVDYTVTGDVNAATAAVDQRSGSGSVWSTLAAGHHFAPEQTARVEVARRSGGTASTAVADAVRLTEFSMQTKEASQRDSWHSYAVGSVVQKWVDAPTANNGVVLKATDDVSGPVGGVFYNASEDVYGGESATRPTLVVTYDEPGVTLNAPSVIHSDGAELSWSKYVDPTPEEDDDLVEYQVFRGCTSLPGGACTSPVGDQYTTSNPAGLELVGTVASDVTSWTDTSAKPSTATTAASYNYWVVARTVADTRSGQDGRASSNVQAVTIPREGRIVRAFSGDLSDTTISSAQPTTVLPRPDDTGHSSRRWLQVGNGHPTYGEERALLEFDLAAIKAGVKVTDARLELYESRGDGSGSTTFDLHALSRDFVEDQATWRQAASTTPWTTQGGDVDAAKLTSVTTTNTPKRLTFASTALQGKVQAWVNSAGDNHGVLLKAGTTAQQYLSLVNSESPDTLLRPRLYVEHLVKNDAQTYQADEIPQRFVPGTTITTPVIVTNTSTSAWPSGLQLSYRWTEPGSTADITVEGDRRYVALGKALQPGESVKLDLPIRTPINSDSGAKRLAYDLYLDLWTGSAWFSATNPPSQNTTEPAQGCAVVTTGFLCVDRYVEDPTSNQLGLEKFLSYAGEETGAGAQLLNNVYSGNAVWSYDAISNPSLGPSTFLRVAYNSMDVTDAGAGFGWSVQPATLTRLGSRLSVPTGGSLNKLMTFIDGDGTTHTYKHDADKSTAARLVYTRPAGVALDLYRDLNETNPDKQWVAHRPDGTRFFFSQSTGLPTSVVDHNNNTLTYTHDANGRLTSVKDAAGRTTLTLGHNTAGLEWIRDLSGRGLKFTYNSSHQLTKLEDGGGFSTATKTFSGQVKSFQFGYTEQSTNSNAKLNSVIDPRGKSTTVAYFTSTENSTYALWPKRYTDRRGNDTTFGYTDPDGSAAKDLITDVTDVNGSTPSVTTYRMDGYGRTTSIRDANANADGATGQLTRLGWDSDHNVIRLEEPNGAVSTWQYNQATGYPLTVRDAQAVKDGQPGTVLTYDTLPTAARPTVLMSKTSAAGRESTFTYDTNGNLKTVRNELGNGPTYTYNTNGTLDTATDANGGVTTYSAYDANGYPTLITDPLTHRTEFDYDDRGNVIQVTDALGQVTTAEYDEFGRPTVTTTPHEGSDTRTARADYDLNDNVTAETAPNGAVTSNTYGDADNVLSTTLPDNTVTSRKLAYQYDPLGRVSTETAPKGVATTGDLNDFVTTYTYDRVGQTLKVENPFVDTDGSSKTAVTSYEYDTVGNVIREVDPNKNATPATDYTTKTSYDLNHRPIVVTDALGHTSRTEYDADGMVTAEIDALGNKRRTVYDQAGQKIELHVPHTPVGSTTAQDRVTRVEYDKVGNPVKEIRPSGKFSETVYDKNNRPVQKKSAFDSASTHYQNPSSTFLKYDEIGRLTSQSDPTFGTAGTQWTDFTYHPSGDIKSSTDPWKISTDYTYNKLGKQLSRTMKGDGDDATRSQSWSYFPDGSLASRSDTEAKEPARLVDNADTWQTAVTGTWSTVSGGTNTQGSNYRTHAAASGSTDRFTWDVTAEVTGEFDVLVSCPVNANATTAATYTINHNGGSATKTIDQKACTSATPWVSLGNFTFPGGSTRTIELAPSASGLVLADAIKLVSTKTPGSRTFSYTYDANGAQTEVKDTTGGALVDTFAVSYDGLGRTKQVREMAGVVAKRETDYTYDRNSNVLSTYARRPADTGTTVGASRFTKYTWDVRNLVDTVESGSTPTSTLDKWSYTYDPRGMRSTLSKPNGNLTTTRFHEDGLLRTLVERRGVASNSPLVSSHTLKYTLDGDRSEDVEKLDQPNSSGFLDQVSKYAYTPARQLASVTRTGADKGDNESYVYDAAGNATTQTIASATSTMTYDRNRLIKTVTGSTTLNHRYDVFGRSSTIDNGTRVIERNNYDGFDRLIRQQKWNTSGVRQSLKSVKFDPFDRTSWQATLTAGQSASVSTRFVYLGLQDQIAVEEQTNTAGTYEVSKTYTHGPGGEKLALIDTPVNATTTKKHFYGHNPHGDVETLTDDAGEATSTYRYTAYGNPDEKGTLGADAITGDPAQDAEVVNPYRFNGKRYEGATGTYDMGFRDYDPSLNRFLTRDHYNGALSDLGLGTDPWTLNRYTFAGGNPITGIELDGHTPCVQADDCTDVDYVYGKGLVKEPLGGTSGGEGTFRHAEEDSQESTDPGLLYENNGDLALAPPGTPGLGGPRVTPRGSSPRGGSPGPLALLSLLLGDTLPQPRPVDVDEQESRCFGATSNVPAIRYFDLDDDGRATGAEACLQGPPPYLDSDPRATPEGWEEGLDRSHLIARRFGGSNTDLRNIIALYPGTNRGSMARIENEVQRRLGRGERVYYAAFPIYKSNLDMFPRLGNVRKVELVVSSRSGSSVYTLLNVG